MEDYQIKSDAHGSLGVSAQTERAQTEAAGAASYERFNACL